MQHRGHHNLAGMAGAHCQQSGMLGSGWMNWSVGAWLDTGHLCIT